MDDCNTPQRPPVAKRFDSPQFQEPGDTLDLLEFPSPETLRDFCHLDMGDSDDELDEELGAEDGTATGQEAIAQLWAFSDLAGAPGSARKDGASAKKGTMQSWKRSSSDSRLDLAGANYFFFDENILNDGEVSDPEDDDEDLDSSLDELLNVGDAAEEWTAPTTPPPDEYVGDHVDAAAYVDHGARVLFQEPGEEDALSLLDFPETRDQGDDDLPFNQNQTNTAINTTTTTAAAAAAEPTELDDVVAALVDTAIDAAVQGLHLELHDAAAAASDAGGDGEGEVAMFQEPGDDVTSLTMFPETRDFGMNEEHEDYFNGTEEEADAADAVILDVASANIHYYAEHMKLADIIFGAVDLVDGLSDYSEADSDSDLDDDILVAHTDGVAADVAVAVAVAVAPTMARPGTSSGNRATSSAVGMDTPVASTTPAASKAGVHTGGKGLFRKLLAGGNASKHSTPQMQMCAARNDEELTPQMDTIQGKSELIARRILAFGANSPLGAQ